VVVVDNEYCLNTTSNGGALSATSALPVALAAPLRRAVARRIRRNQANLVRGWLDRHSTQQRYAAHVQLVLDDWDRYGRCFAEPLNYALARWFATGRPELLHLYRSKRKLFLPTEVMSSGGEAELRVILAQDASHLKRIVNGVVPKGDAARLVDSVIDEIHAPPTQGDAGRAVKVAFVGDCIMDEVRCFLDPLSEAAGTMMEQHHFYFSAGLGVELDTGQLDDAIERVGFDLIALSFLTFEGLPIYTSLLQEAHSGSADRHTLAVKCDAILTVVDRYVSNIRLTTSAPILLHGCSSIIRRRRWRRVLPVLPAMTRGQAFVTRVLNTGLKEISTGIENVVFVDEAARVAQVGYRRATKGVLPSSVTDGAFLHPSELGVLLAQDYARVVTAYELLGATKVLLIDFDNTLWTGVMADGDVVHDRAAQTLLKELKEAGILLVSVSKNEPKNIRWQEMVLSQDDFVLHKIGWDTKAQSVTEVAQQLDLDPKSFVLIDDNPIERDLVTATMPGVKALDPADRQTWENLRLLLRFPATRQTDEASRRTQMYREAAKRREATSATVDYAGMMRSLDLKVGWRRATVGDLNRVHELVSRTSQFNTTSVRYSVNDLNGLLASAEHDVFITSMADKFGSLGIVGIVIARVSGGVLTYESVVMSCRAMGFGLESVLVRKPLDAHPALARAVGHYVPTQRNNPCAKLFAEHGFRNIDDQHWEWEPTNQRPHVPDWLTIECD
jgi:FkbH-like protein